jgi:hypothetical protein
MRKKMKGNQSTFKQQNKQKELPQQIQYCCVDSQQKKQILRKSSTIRQE